LTSGVAVGGVAIAVAALIATLAVMTGFREDIRAKILGAQPHVLVQGVEGHLPDRDWSSFVDGVPGVSAWAPYVLEQALVRRGNATQGAVVKGVDPAREPAVTGLDRKVIAGFWDDLNDDPKNPPVLIGKSLAENLGASPGSSVLLAVPSSAESGLGGFGSLPFFVSARVVGVLETGLFDYDSSLIVMPLASARRIFGRTATVSGLGVRLTDADDSVGASLRLQQKFGSLAFVRSWLALNKPLFAALKLEKVVMFLILTLITLVAAFTILSNLLLVTAQRVREIGILRALGAVRGSIYRIFLLKGLLLGLLGTGIGTGLGLVISLLLKRYQFIQLPADIYYVEKLPVRILPVDVALVAGAAVAIVLLATLYPARVASRLDALEAIRHD
jgi:lipoprotein-releasing system permease protein